MTIASLVLLVSVLLVAAMNWPELRDAWRKTSRKNLERVLGEGEPRLDTLRPQRSSDESGALLVADDAPSPSPSTPLTRPGASLRPQPPTSPPEAPGSVSRVFDREQADLRADLWPLLHRELS